VIKVQRKEEKIKSRCFTHVAIKFTRRYGHTNRKLIRCMLSKRENLAVVEWTLRKKRDVDLSSFPPFHT
jgi:hypothetical protein